ncbi:MAG: BspA family leucine-rich repeat surface protein [Bacteroidales bacterium]|nr:BspA family leucine-rich repeat surface protein [Bacteroidales bacterium]
MKKILIFTVLAAALASCGQDPEPEITPAPDFIAVIENVATKTSVSTTGDVYNITWAAGDEVLITGRSQATYKVKTAGGVRSDLEKVSGDAGNGPFTAVYPANLAENMTLPSTVQYRPDPVVTAPMVATSNNNILPFKSICGMLKIAVTSATSITLKTLRITADKPLSGNYRLVDGEAVIDSGEGVTIDCGDGLELGSTAVPFAFEVPAGRYSDIRFKAVDAVGREYDATLGNRPFVVERSKVYTYNLSFGDLKHLTTTLIDGPEFNLKIKSIAQGKTIDSTTFQDKKIKKIVFEANSSVTSGTELQTPASDYPIYANFDSGEGVMTISTPAVEMFAPKDASCMFQNIQQTIEIANLAVLNTSKVKSMKKMFSQDTSSVGRLGAIDLSSFDVSEVVDMDSMFFSAKYIVNLDLSSFKPVKCENFNSFVARCAKLESIDLSNFETPAAADMSYMFANCTKLASLDLSKFNTSNVTTMAYMFKSLSALTSLNLTSFDTGNVENMDNMFSGCTKLTTLDVSSFNTENVAEMRSMFNSCESLTSLDLKNFNVIACTRMSYMFYHCYAMQTLDVSSFDLTVMSPNCDYMFCRMYNLKDLYLGSTFILTSLPSYFVTASGDATSVRTGNKSGGVTIYCNETTAEFIATTNWRWIQSGYNGQKSIPVTFRDIETNEIITVTWAAN